MTRLGVILGTVRSNRVGASVAQWVVDKANTVEGVNADVIDIASFNMSLFAEPMPPAMATPQDPGGAKFNETVSSLRCADLCFSGVQPLNSWRPEERYRLP